MDCTSRRQVDQQGAGLTPQRGSSWGRGRLVDGESSQEGEVGNGRYRSDEWGWGWFQVK